jgi:hypothetical protein
MFYFVSPYLNKRLYNFRKIVIFQKETNCRVNFFKEAFALKKTLLLMLLFITFFSLVGCGNEEEKIIQQEIEDFVKEYKSTLYSVDDPLNPPSALEVSQNARHYLAKDEFENLMANRIFDLASNTAKSLNKQIVLEDVIFDKVTFNDDGGAWDCEITLKIKLFDQQSSGIFEKKGQLSIMRNSNDALMIVRDWEERIKVDGELL